VPHPAAPGTVISAHELRSVGPEELRSLCERHGPALLRGPETAIALSKRLDDATLGPLLDQWHQRGAMSRERFQWISDALQSQGRGRLVDDIRFDWLQRTRPDIQSPTQLNARIEDMRTRALPEDQVFRGLGEALSGTSTALKPEELRLFGPEPSAGADDPRSAGPVDAWFRTLRDAMTGAPRRLTPTQFRRILAGDGEASRVEALLNQMPVKTCSRLLNELSRVIRECPMTDKERIELVGTSSDFWKDIESRWTPCGDEPFALHRFLGLRRLADCANQSRTDPHEIRQLLINGSVTTIRVVVEETQVSSDLQNGTISLTATRTRAKTQRRMHDGLASPLEGFAALRAVGEYPWGDPKLGRGTLRSILACGGSAAQPRSLIQDAYNDMTTSLFNGVVAETLLACKALEFSVGETLELLQLDVDQPYHPETALSWDATKEALLASDSEGALPSHIGDWFSGLPD